MSIADTFPQAYFRDVHFPVERSRILFALRDHVHEFPHTPGGAPEKLGRRLYQFQVSAVFDERFDSYPGLYPSGLDTLMGYAEQQTTGPFRLPQMVQEVSAYILTADREWNNRIRSGERVDIVFREDQSSTFLFSDLVSVQTGSITQSNADAQAQLAAVRAQLAMDQPTQDLFTALTNTVASIKGLQDQAELYGNRLQGMVQDGINLCKTLDSAAPLLVVPAWPVVNALHDLWSALQTMNDDILKQGVTLQTFIVPIDEDIGRVSTSIFGDSTHVSDLLSLNAIVDPMLVKAGTSIRYYPAH